MKIKMYRDENENQKTNTGTKLIFLVCFFIPKGIENNCKRRRKGKTLLLYWFSPNSQSLRFCYFSLICKSLSPFFLIYVFLLKNLFSWKIKQSPQSHWFMNKFGVVGFLIYLCNNGYKTCLCTRTHICT